MRWFKHMTSANTGETMSAIQDEMGFEGVGMYWTLVEVVAFHWDGKGRPAITRSVKAWRKLTGIYPKTFEKLVRFLGGISDLSATFSEKGIEVCIPKLQELKDEYARKSGQHQDNVAPETETDTDTEERTPHKPPVGGRPSTPPIPKPKTKKTAPAYTQSFEAWWAEYPKKVGKDAAFRSWQKVSKRGDVTVKQLVESVRSQVEADHFTGRDGNDFTPNPSTWLNQGRWQDVIKKPQEVVF